MNCNGVHGISLYLSNNNIFSENTISYNGHYGIRFVDGDNNDILGNTANNNTLDGIDLSYCNNSSSIT